MLHPHPAQTDPGNPLMATGSEQTPKMYDEHGLFAEALHVSLSEHHRGLQSSVQATAAAPQPDSNTTPSQQPPSSEAIDIAPSSFPHVHSTSGSQSPIPGLEISLAAGNNMAARTFFERLEERGLQVQGARTAAGVVATCSNDNEIALLSCSHPRMQRRISGESKAAAETEPSAYTSKFAARRAASAERRGSYSSLGTDQKAAGPSSLVGPRSSPAFSRPHALVPSTPPPPLRGSSLLVPASASSSRLNLTIPAFPSPSVAEYGRRPSVSSAHVPGSGSHPSSLRTATSYSALEHSSTQFRRSVLGTCSNRRTSLSLSPSPGSVSGPSPLAGGSSPLSSIPHSGIGLGLGSGSPIHAQRRASSGMAPASARHFRNLACGGLAQQHAQTFDDASFPAGGGGFAASASTSPSLSTSSLLSASLVGSYEESLLSGRMSAARSKALMFDAELGVLGSVASSPKTTLLTPPRKKMASSMQTDESGSCAPSIPSESDSATRTAIAMKRKKLAGLRCPRHLKLSFPAHFYNLPSSSGLSTTLSPGADGTALNDASINSPYVGNIDLEAYYMNRLVDVHLSTMGPDGHGVPPEPQSVEQLIKAKRSLPDFPGYRVPPKGQIQLIIKNPNLTAVKVFLVPYDMSEMACGQRTFIRQKCYVQSPAAAGATSLAPSPASASPSSKQTAAPARDALRYAVHLQFCSPPAEYSSATSGSSKKTDSPSTAAEPKIYLHRNIRVVFMARVPDQSEKLITVNEALDVPTSPMQPIKRSLEHTAVTSQAGSSFPLSFFADLPRRERQMLFGSFPGPGDDWCKALKQAKLNIKKAIRHRQKKADKSPVPPTVEQLSGASLLEPARPIPLIVGDPAGVRQEPGLNGSFDSFGPASHFSADAPINDPNGELWDQETDAGKTSRRREAEEEGKPMPRALGLHSPPQSVHPMTSDLPPVSSFPAAHLDNGMPASTDAGAVSEPPRALLDAWQQTLRRRAVSPQLVPRPVSGRMSPEVMRSSTPVTSPTLRPISPTESLSNSVSMLSLTQPNRSAAQQWRSDSDHEGGGAATNRARQLSVSSAHSHHSNHRPQTPNSAGPSPAELTTLSATAIMAHDELFGDDAASDARALLTTQALHAPPR